MKRQLLWIALSLLFFPTQAQEAAERELFGTVLADTGEPLVGVSIAAYQNEEMIGGTVTDITGFYLLTSNADALEFSYMGYETVRVPTTELDRLSTIALKSDVLNLDEVVVIAFTDSRGCRCIWCGGTAPVHRSAFVSIEIGAIQGGTWKVYPNPTVNEVHIRTGELEGIITLLSAQGAELQRTRINGPLTRIDLSRLPAATYYLRYENEGWMETLGPVVKISR